MTARKRNVVFFVAWCAVITTLTSLPTTPWVGPDTLSWDKIAHAGVYAVFALLYLRMRAHARRPVIELIPVAAVYAVADELHQLWIPGRQCSVWDLVADMAGVAIVIVATYLVRSLRERKLQTNE